jgi:hypothetical protein
MGKNKKEHIPTTAERIRDSIFRLRENGLTTKELMTLSYAFGMAYRQGIGMTYEEVEKIINNALTADIPKDPLFAEAERLCESGPCDFDLHTRECNKRYNNARAGK